MMHLRVVPGALLLLVVFAACSDNASNDLRTGTDTLATNDGYVGTPFVESITLKRDDSGSAGAAIEAPTAQDNPFHAILGVRKGEGDVVVTVDLIAVDAGGERNTMIVSQQYNLRGLSREADVKFALPQDWPSGQYRIDTYIYEKPSKSKVFSIR